MFTISCPGERWDFRIEINYFKHFLLSSELEQHFKIVQYRRPIFVSHNHPFFLLLWLNIQLYFDFIQYEYKEPTLYF